MHDTTQQTRNILHTQPEVNSRVNSTIWCMSKMCFPLVNSYLSLLNTTLFCVCSASPELT